MNRKKSNFFTIKQLRQLMQGCNYLFLIGERSNGKSYSVKHHCLDDAFKHIEGNKCTREFAYIRRFERDCKDSVCEPYFADMPISTITDGRYDSISIYRKKIYFSNINEEGKTVRGVCIGACFALSSAEHYKSLMYPNIYNVIYEEVISQNNDYLYREPFAFQQLISTILRDRTGQVFLVGNTLSRMCPYYMEYGLRNVENLEQGKCNIYHIDKTTIKVYRCDSRGVNSGMFFGSSGKNITQGEYYTEEKPRLEKKIKEYDIKYTCVLKHETFTYLMQFLKDKDNNYFWYVSPKTSDLFENTRVISHQYNSDPRWTDGFFPLSAGEQTAFDMLLKYNKVVYSDNLTGTEFEQILEEY